MGTMKIRSGAVVAALFFIFTYGSYAADVNYPYVNINLQLPPSENPFPGFGNYFSTLSFGMKSALWNPASLGKLKLSETSLSMISDNRSYLLENTSKVAEKSGTIEAGEGSSGSAGRYAYFFRYPKDIGTGINTKEVEILSSINYATSGTGINFTSAHKLTDWLVVGFATENPLGANIELAGEFPVTARINTNFYGQKIGDMQISNDGKLKYTFSSGGTIATYESTKPLWSGFLSQEATIPFNSITESRNNINFQSPYVGTIASKLGNFYAGINMIPISASANIDNDVRAVINADTQNVFFYTPNFDKNSESELANWINDPDKYGSPEGYLRKQIVLPAREILANAKYRGFYSASTARLDLGAMYDLTDWLTLGFSMENIGGASLNFKGNGIASYINHRDINTAEAGSLEDIVSPGGKNTIDFFTDTWVTTDEVGENKLYLEPEKNYTLPKKIRYGFALKRPFLIAVDYEQNLNSITIPGSVESKNIIISNLSFLRIGTESELFNLPFWMRSGVTFILKPTVTGLDQEAQENLDKYFKYGVIPVKLDFGYTLNLWSYEIGESFGINLTPMLSLLQLDTTNIDLSKIVYYSFSLQKDAWQVSYLYQIDPASTGAAFKNKPAGADGKKEFNFSDIKFVQTLGVTYRF